MDRRVIIGAGIGCVVLLLLAVVAVILLIAPFQLVRTTETTFPDDGAVELVVTPQPVEAVEDGDARPINQGGNQLQLPEDASLTELYEAVNPGVVNIQAFVGGEFGGQGAGSGFILDEAGHIVTNNHVVAQAETVTVIFYNGLEENAEIVGTDDDSDLAVLRVENLPEGTYPLPLGDSDQVEAGDWVIAIGNPFSLGGSITLGIISAVGRSIPSGVTPFAIPQAIQTDAAINPGNSGGPLLNLDGQVVGVNAQIRTTSAVPANSGVGFAIPVNVVHRVAPALIVEGSYQWPWLGVNRPASVNLLLVEANDLETQQGVYIHQVVPGGPADEAGLQGSTGTTAVNGLDIPTGGDVILEVNGAPLANLDQLLEEIAFSNPGDALTLTVLRNGEQEQLTVTLDARPQNFEQLQP